MRPILIALLCVRPAIAETRVTVIERTVIERTPITLGTPLSARLESARVVRDGGRARLTVVLATDAAGLNEGVLPIMPGGARATALTVTIDGSRVRAEAMDATDAREAFRRIVNWRDDPALLEQTGADSLRLRVFPLVADHPVTVDITFELAPSRESDGVDRKTSLYAGVPVVVPALARGDRVVIDGPDSDVTRRVLDLAIPTLRSCFTLAVGRSFERSAVLRFMIDRDGSVGSISTASLEARRCLRTRMKAWQFASAERETQVIYPLHLLVPTS